MGPGNGSRVVEVTPVRKALSQLKVEVTGNPKSVKQFAALPTPKP